MKSNGKIWIFYDAKEKKQSKPLSLTQAQALIFNIHAKKSTVVYLWTPGWSEWVELFKYLSTEQNFFVLPPAIKKKIHDIHEITQATKTVKYSSKSAMNSLNQTNVDDDKTIKISIPLDTPTHEIHFEEKEEKVDYGYFFPDFKIDQIDLSVNKLNRAGSLAKGLQKGGLHSSLDDKRGNIRFNFRLQVVLISKSGKIFTSLSEDISLGGIKLQDNVPKDFMLNDFTIIITNHLEKDPKKSKVNLNTKVVGDISDPSRLVFVNPDPRNRFLLENLINSCLRLTKKETRSA